MRRIAQTVLLVVGGWVVLALTFDGLIGIFQFQLEPGSAEGVLRTFDAEGRPHESRMIVIEDGDTLWVQSGHHFRGWYHRLRANPEVELVRGGETRAYRAVAPDDPETKRHMVGLLKERTGTAGFYAIRAVLLFAEVKPVRLDPR